MADIEDLYNNKKYNNLQWDNLIKEFNDFTFADKSDYNKFRIYIQNKYKIVITKSELIKLYNHLSYNNINMKNIITKKKNKSNSGVLVITVLTSANPEYIDDNNNKVVNNFSCKHDCFYCPNEPAHENNNWVEQPRSYLYSEPAVLRANQNNFDPILQINSRLNDLLNMGHFLDKLEILVLGGTWSGYHKNYQKDFIKKLYYAANTFYDIASSKREILSLEEEISFNEYNSKIHIIGLTLETRPDTITLEEIRNFRLYNCTRIQLGVQHTNNKILKKINRGHDIESVYNAIKILKNNCFKVDIHIMPNLPDSTPEIDKEMFNNILEDDRIQADQIKIYPCAIVPWTKIKKWYDEGTYKPYDDYDLYKLIKDFKKRIQNYKRINRIIRDIPCQYITGGYNKETVNIRQLLQNDMKKNNWCCKCIRCREIKDNQINIDDIKLKIIRYKSSDGIEYFISLETIDYLIGFIRLRINYNYDNVLDVLKNCSLIRELHVYGNLNIVDGDLFNSNTQHRGFGKRLIEEAEKISIIHKLYKIAIISGTGVRNYYRKFGYNLVDTYMIKKLYYFNYFNFYKNKMI